jgi:hypothetical protein
MDIKDELGGIKVPPEEIEGVFEALEGEGNLIYGQIGSGKSYLATAMIHEDIRHGDVVYATWPVFFKKETQDDRQDFWFVLKNLLTFKKRFYRIEQRHNFHYINAETGEVDGIQAFDASRRGQYIAYLNKLNHCKLYVDEAWRVIDSYQKTEFSEEGRNLILVTRHKYRTVYLISQRAMGIHITARANMNRFYKCVKIFGGLGFIPPRFAMYEFQEMVGETVNEDAEPISVKKYWGKQDIFESYNSWYYGELEPLHKPHFSAFDLTLKEKIIAFFRIMFKKKDNSYPQKKVVDEVPF